MPIVYFGNPSWGPTDGMLWMFLQKQWINECWTKSIWQKGTDSLLACFHLITHQLSNPAVCFHSFIYVNNNLVSSHWPISFWIHQLWNNFHCVGTKMAFKSRVGGYRVNKPFSQMRKKLSMYFWCDGYLIDVPYACPLWCKSLWV